MKKCICFFAFLCCVGVLLGSSVSDPFRNAPLQIVFLDVGQGDAVLLRTAEGAVLIDAGTEESEELLCLRLESLGIKRLSLAIFTHFDEDHIGGADGVLQRFPTDRIWIGGAAADNGVSHRLLAVAERTGTEVVRVCNGDFFSMEDLFLYVLAPAAHSQTAGNEGSLVIHLRYGKIKALFMGDATTEQEASLVDYYGRSQLSADLCKVAHHGSNTSTSELFLQTVQPRYAVISCGADNSYGHPTGSVLARLRAHGSIVLRTDLQGEITFVCDGETLSLYDGG